MTTTQSDPATLYTVVQTLLHTEEANPRPIDMTSWQDALARRAVLVVSVQDLEQAVAASRRLLDALPALARPEHVYWAQALLALPNLAFLEVDTDGLGTHADILRIALVDRAGALLYDRVFQARRPVSPKIGHLTGITPGMLSRAHPLAESWQEVMAAFVGRYILSFNLEFDSSKLSESAARHGLPVLPLVGDCLMLRAQQYYGTHSYPKLADLCERLGAPLPPHPQQDALDRARGQVELLRAMAQGITHAPAAHQIPDEAESSGAGDPFLPDVPDENE